MDAKQAMKFAQENEAQFVDIKFMDFVGLWQHFALPIQEFDLAMFQDGLGFDGSSIRGWRSTHPSDLLVIPDPTTAKIDPFPRARCLSLIGNIFDPTTREPYSRDPRHIAQKAEAYLKSTGLGDTAYFGPEAEFFIFDDVRFDQTRNSAFYFVDADEGRWNTGRDEQPNLAYKLRYNEGSFSVPPTDSLVDLRQEMVLELIRAGLHVEVEHHQAATGGQAEIDLRHAPLLEQADNLQWFKYILKNVARRNGKALTFMPKPLHDDHGTGMHTHISLWKDGENLFAGQKYAGLSQMALHFIGGLLKHAPALCAICNPSTNSYRRLVPGFEAPVSLAYSTRNRSAACRIPTYTAGPKATRVEYRIPDPSCNGYLAFAAMLMAGLDGIENQRDPGEPLDRDIYGLPPEELADVPSAPGSLEEALDALEADHEFLLKGAVFTEDAVEMWLSHKRTNEVDALRACPTPGEFRLYFDC